MRQNAFSAPHPAGGTYSAPPEPLAGFGGEVGNGRGCKGKSNSPNKNSGYGIDGVVYNHVEKSADRNTILFNAQTVLPSNGKRKQVPKLEILS